MERQSERWRQTSGGWNGINGTETNMWLPYVWYLFNEKVKGYQHISNLWTGISVVLNRPAVSSPPFSHRFRETVTSQEEESRISLQLQRLPLASHHTPPLTSLINLAAQPWATSPSLISHHPQLLQSTELSFLRIENIQGNSKKKKDIRL
jgi:hypothetical protein